MTCTSRSMEHMGASVDNYRQVWNAHLHPQTLSRIALIGQLAQGGLWVESVEVE